MFATLRVMALERGEADAAATSTTSPKLMGETAVEPTGPEMVSPATVVTLPSSTNRGWTALRAARVCVNKTSRLGPFELKPLRTSKELSCMLILRLAVPPDSRAMGWLM